ncbi:MAG TPA: tripartite tricarboxylate transporter substrate-binding protein [Burkholderiales bacterium]|nr:tripartite tricarboxylate transporter substrate-binding protein [Burkholderiales bacterium]
MTRSRNLLAAFAAMLLGALLSAASPAFGADFSGKRIEFVIPFGTGGGSDVWARFLAPRLSEALPGKPVVAVRNEPGGGSITGTNQFAARARPDGLTILGTSGSTQFPYLLGDPRVKYDYKDWTVILATPTGGVVYAQPDLGAKSADEVMKLKGKRLVYGSQGATSLDLVVPLAFEILGLDLQVVFGMKGRGPARLAFERGESTVDYQTTAAYLQSVEPLVKAGNAVPLWAWGTINEQGELVRDPTFPDLPHFGEVYEKVHGRKASGTGWNAWKSFFVAGFAAQKMVFLPKGTPKDIVDTYRQAVARMVAAPDFKDAAQQALGEFDQGIGPRAERLAELATGVDPEARAFVRDWLTRKYNVKF